MQRDNIFIESAEEMQALKEVMWNVGVKLGNKRIEFEKNRLNVYKEFHKLMPDVSRGTIKTLLGVNGDRSTDNPKGCSMSILIDIAKGLNVSLQSFFVVKKEKASGNLSDYDRMPFKNYPNAWNVFIRNMESVCSKMKGNSTELAFVKVMGSEAQRRKAREKDAKNVKEYYGKTLNVRLINVIRLMKRADASIPMAKWFDRWNGVVYDDELANLNQLRPYLLHEDVPEMLACRVGSLEEMEKHYSFQSKNWEEYFESKGIQQAGIYDIEWDDDLEDYNTHMIDSDEDGYVMVRTRFDDNRFLLADWDKLYKFYGVKMGDILLRCFFYSEQDGDVMEFIINLTRIDSEQISRITDTSSYEQKGSIMINGIGHERMYKVVCEKGVSIEELSKDPFRIYHDLDYDPESGKPKKEYKTILFLGDPQNIGSNYLKDHTKSDEERTIEEIIRERMHRLRSDSNAEKPSYTIGFEEWYLVNSVIQLSANREEKTIEMIIPESDDIRLTVSWDMDILRYNMICKLRKIMESKGYEKRFREEYVERIEENGIEWLIATHRLAMKLFVPKDKLKPIEWYWQLTIRYPEEDSIRT